MNIFNFDFILSFFYFLIAIFIAFYIPGVVFISKLKLSRFQEVVISFLFGLVLWGFQGFIFGYLNLRFLSYAYLFIFIAIYLFTRKERLLKKPSLFKLPKVDPIICAIIGIGLIIQIVAVWFNGVMVKEGLLFCCGSVQDSVLHLAITDEIVKRFPPFEPGMYGSLLTNYHYWGSLVIAELVRVFNLPLIPTTYQFMTIFVSLFLGFSSLVFGELLKIGKVFNRWLLFFLYFGGDFVWLLIGIFRGNSYFAMRPLESGSQFLENLPRAFAIILFFAAFSLFILWIKKKDLYTGIIMSIILASIVGFKVNIGFFAFSGLAILGLYYIYKREYRMLIPLITAVILGLILYIPVNGGSGGLYFTGMWRFENFVVQPWLTLERLELARVIYAQHNNYLRVVAYELLYIGIFMFAIFGTKLLGFIQNRRSLSLLPRELNIVFLSAIFASFITGSFFAQTSGGSNSFNFLVSIFVLGSLYTALACYYWLKGVNIYVKYFLIVIIVIFTVTRVLNQSYSYVENFRLRQGYIVTNTELKAVDFLKKQPSKILITDPDLEIDKNSPYLTFLTRQKMYLSGIINELSAHDIDYKGNLKVRDRILQSKSPKVVAVQMRDNNIEYLYLLTSTKLAATASAGFLDPIYVNNQVKILKFNLEKARKYLK